ncbi:MAG: hypothetical protein IJN50_02900 [Clostridia bacterium]|nr:hypothetical protein [Clostridia bacterium]
MVIAFVTFLLARVGINLTLNWVIGNSVAIYTLLALLIFGGLAMTLIPGSGNRPSPFRRWGWLCFVAAVLGYVAVSVLAPFTQTVSIVLAILVAVVVLVISKRAIFRWLHNHGEIPSWATWILRLI